VDGSPVSHAFGTGVIVQTWSLQGAVIPAKAGIHSANLWNALARDWIPAFAGMTGVSKGILSPMTPALHLAASTHFAHVFCMAITKAFRSGKSQAVRIPKKFRSRHQHPYLHRQAKSFDELRS
jgi:hypothetical protein